MFKLQEVGILKGAMIKNLLKNGKKFLNSRQNDILSAAFIMMLAVFLSRFLGLLRDRLLAYFFTPEELGVYFAAFRIPDMLFSILVMGALTTAFIPVITDYFIKDKREEAFLVASSIINICLGAFFLLSLLVIIFSRNLSLLIAPGFSPEKIKIVSSLTKIMLISQFFFIISNFLTGILQAEKHFIIPAISPILYNLGIIAGTIVFSPFLGIYGPVLGTIIGAFFHLLIQVPAVKNLGFKYKLIVNFSSGVKRVLRLMIPRTFGLIASQINFTVDNILASLISPSAITIFNFASHLQQVPIGLFGATIAQAALPTLSEEKTKENFDNFVKNLINSIYQIAFLTIPSAVILIVLRIPLVRLVFGAIKFDWLATYKTSLTLTFFSFGIFFQGAIHLLARAFYSLHDSKTPLFISVFSVFINIIFSIIFILSLKLEVWGLAISSVLADILNFTLLFYFLGKRLREEFLKKIFYRILKIIFVSLLMGVIIYLLVKFLDLFILDTKQTLNLIFLTFTSLFFGLGVFVFFSFVFKIEEIFMIKELFRKISKISLVFKPVSPLTPETQEKITP